MIKDFREFIARGNILDLAVGLSVGAAFGKIVSSFVSDILMPPIGLFLGGVDFSNLKLTLKSASATSEAVTLNYGTFINTVLDFLIIALAVFLLITHLQKFRRKQTAKAPATEAAPSAEERLLTEIRDLLKK